MILPLSLLTSPIPPTPFPNELQGIWDESEYSCSQPNSSSRVAIVGSHIEGEGMRGYSISDDRLSARTFIVKVVRTYPGKSYQALKRYELSEDGNKLFFQSHAISKKKSAVTAQLLVRCSDQDKLSERYK